MFDQNEKVQLLEYCQNFSEELIKNPEIYDGIYGEAYMETMAPVLKPFSALCDRTCEIVFHENTFCFTGPARSGPRKKLNEIVVNLGGIPKNSIAFNLNYLVIGAQSSPCWAYSTYGRKIEQVLQYRKEGSETTILHENDFIQQATT
jgi:NAD-dependent DNA ligase